MTRLHPKPYEVQQLGYICRYCGAGEGVWCTVPNGSWAGFLHSDRFYQARREARKFRPAGTDFPRDAAAESRLVEALTAEQLVDRLVIEEPA